MPFTTLRSETWFQNLRADKLIRVYLILLFFMFSVVQVNGSNRKVRHIRVLVEFDLRFMQC